MWQNENGPNGGDEINILKPGANYGWPIVSYGRLSRAVAVRDSGTRRVRAAGRLLGAVDRRVGHGVLHRRQVPEVEGRRVRRRAAHGEIPGTGHLERILFNEKMEELRRESLHEKEGAVLRIEPVQ